MHEYIDRSRGRPRRQDKGKKMQGARARSPVYIPDKKTPLHATVAVNTMNPYLRHLTK